MPPVITTITVTGTLDDIFSAADNGGTLIVTLQRYGSVMPTTGNVFLSNIQKVVACPAGTFSITLNCNDVINPNGTTYVFIFIPANGGPVQCLEYQFASGNTPNTFALASLTPFVRPAA